MGDFHRLDKLIMWFIVFWNIITIILAIPRVEIEQGPLRGTTMWSRKGRLFYAFQGIPYAAPPVDNLRFKAPSKPLNWTDELDARMERNSCLQVQLLISDSIIGDEDCLYLNVFTPQLKNEEESLLSVMMWIHGGGFIVQAGGNDFYGPHFLLDRDIVLVTINYRLGALGFLSLNTKEASGNYGLKDQIAALQWVKKNIAKFGGNPNSVTVFGQSAGAASIHYLMLSPLARGLFHRAIMQSGSAYNPWASSGHAAQYAHELAQSLGCDKPNEVLACLRKADAHKLVKLATDMHLNAVRVDSKRCTFSPTMEPPGTEDAILSDEPRSMLEQGNINSVPLIAGVNTHEGILHTFLLQNQTIWQDYIDNFARFLPDEVPRQSPTALAASIDINEFYTQACNGDFLQQYIKINSDVDFVLGVDEFVRGLAALQRHPVYYYQFSYNGRLGTIKNLKFPALDGTAHGDELGYLFSPKLLQAVPWSALWQQDITTIERLTTLWSNFATYGQPTHEGYLKIDWKPVAVSTSNPREVNTRYLDIGTDLNMNFNDLNGETIKFWWQVSNQSIS